MAGQIYKQTAAVVLRHIPGAQVFRSMLHVVVADNEGVNVTNAHYSVVFAPTSVTTSYVKKATAYAVLAETASTPALVYKTDAYVVLSPPPVVARKTTAYAVIAVTLGAKSYKTNAYAVIQYAPIVKTYKTSSYAILNYISKAFAR